MQAHILELRRFIRQIYSGENPDVNFIKPCNLCPHMKSITLSNILDCMQNKKNEILIDSNTLERARGSIEKMVAVGRQD